ncbi:alpha/beta hydrolase [Intrasporangium oryzae NRRL B-24470]|uniref:Alpha/beta hydrolase n=1 Tax=Intrasporangium oryzae NRRL B-24470 TaxID=1386089 RepID=W9G8K5_9MICO|nr:alpha/beta hydrolase [Intrasporangium oryzae]EWT02390.1 alpha/beta hydrolase [Intrasporangium oryzae NRRL B-24470]
MTPSSPFTCSIVETPRLAVNVWTSGPEDGVPLLLVHGNLTTGGFWTYVAAELPDDVRVIAPDLRGFGLTDPAPVDATRGLGDMVDDVHALLETLGLAGRAVVNAVGWSMGGGVLEQLMIEHPDDLASVTLVAPLSPYGFGGTTDEHGTRAFSDGASAGAGGANPDFVRRLGARDASEDEPMSSPRVVMRTFFGAGDNAPHVDEDFLVAELLTTRTGEDFYPGDAAPSENWPTLAPGDRGILNTMAPTHYDASGIVDLTRKPPVTWVHGTADQVVSDRSMFDLATLGELGAIPGWPGADVLPPQPMVAQMRAVLAAYAAAGGTTREVALEGVAHGIPLEVPARLAEEIVATLVR